MRACCVICGRDLSQEPAMRDDVTGLSYCAEHSSSMRSMDGAALSGCQSCGLRYSREHSAFYVGPGSRCPSCGQALDDTGGVGTMADAVLRALEQWMAQAPAGDAADLVNQLDNIGDPNGEVYGGWGVDWEACTAVEALGILRACFDADLAEGPNEVELRGSVPGDEIGGIPVWTLHPTPKEIDRSLIQVVAGRYLHYLAKLDADLFGVLVHQGEIATKFQGTNKARALALVEHQAGT